MSDISKKYTVIREYENKYSIEELLKKIIRIHIESMYHGKVNITECSNHEVNTYEKY